MPTSIGAGAYVGKPQAPLSQTPRPRGAHPACDLRTARPSRVVTAQVVAVMRRGGQWTRSALCARLQLESNSKFEIMNRHLGALKDAGLVRIVPNAEKTCGVKAMAWEWIE